jgi:BirA family biotin operon repressor/biotin-[acetyl-CoA-carboxylase] ligase
MQKIEPIRLPKIKEKLQTKLIGKTIHHFSEITSTNDLAKEMATMGAREGTVILAETQTRGKGRLGRKWASPRGGIWLSTILRPKLSAKDTPKLTLMTSLAVAKTINQLFNLKTEVKWPNDVLINTKKVCGILTEAETRGGTTNFVVVGIGINANVELSSLPKQVRENATSLRHELKREIDREQFLRVLLGKMEHYYAMLAKGRFSQVLEEWKSLCGFLGSYVEVTSGEEKIEGWAIDVDINGALTMRLQDGTLRKVLSGDVSLARSKRLRHQKQ